MKRIQWTPFRIAVEIRTKGEEGVGVVTLHLTLALALYVIWRVLTLVPRVPLVPLLYTLGMLI